MPRPRIPGRSSSPSGIAGEPPGYRPPRAIGGKVALVALIALAGIAPSTGCTSSGVTAGERSRAASASLDAAVRGLRDSDPVVRHRSAALLIERGGEAIPALEVAIGEADWPVRSQVVHVLGRIGDEALPALADAARDPDWRVRAHVAEALESIEDPRAVAILVDALDDSSPFVRIRAARSLRPFGPAASEAVPRLVVLLGNVDLSVQRAATEALLAVGPLAIPRLISAVEAGWPRLRARSAWILGQFGAAGREALPSLQRATEDPDPRVREAASEAVALLEGARR